MLEVVLPLYEYQCEKCGRFELIRKFSDEPVTTCPTCGREVRKLFSAPAIQFKGTGWYVTDYARKSSGDDGASSSKDGSKEGSKDSSKDSSSKDASSTPATTTSKGGSASGSPK